MGEKGIKASRHEGMKARRHEGTKARRREGTKCKAATISGGRGPGAGVVAGGDRKESAVSHSQAASPRPQAFVSRFGRSSNALMAGFGRERRPLDR